MQSESTAEFSFKQSLTSPQWEAVKCVDGPLLVLAGAGSGKTRVITYRIAYLVQEVGINPWNIIAVTFTNKAAQEMGKRLENLLGHQAKNIFISTIHSACLKILRSQIEKIDRSSQFVIFDKADQTALIKQCIQEANLPEKGLTPASVLGEINRAKNELVSCNKYNDKANNFFQKKVAQVYIIYERELKKNEALDFADLILKCVNLFREYPDVLEYYQDRLPYLLVDEYQDTNLSQATFLDLLAEKYQNICVVGDDDQSIYKWRGAEVKNVLQFEDKYPKAKIIYLEQNYRSTKTILSAAESVVSNNTKRKEKKLWTNNEDGEPIYCYKARDEFKEAGFICRTIKENYSKSHPHFGDFVILYRTNAQSRVIEEAMHKSVIPYVIVGGLRFYERKEIKDLMAYLKVINNPQDDISLNRIINVPARGIGDTTLSRLNDFAKENNLSLFKAIEAIIEMDNTIVSPNICSRLKKLNLFFNNQIKNLKAKHCITSILEEVIDEIDYIKYLEREKSHFTVARVENVKELISATMEFEGNNPEDSTNLAQFLDQVALVNESDENNKDSLQGRVTLMTMHSVKGMEFPVVFMAGVEEGLFPHSRSLYDRAELEEERRLCYVGMTRAKKKLYLSWALQRNVFGKTQLKTKSRFVNEIPPRFIKSIEDSPYEKLSSRSRNFSGDFNMPDSVVGNNMDINVNADNSNIYKVGSLVHHPIFGGGVIMKKEGKGDKIQLIVNFNGNYMRLMAKYAKLQVQRK